MVAKADVDFDVLTECLEKGMTTREAADLFNCSHSTISRRIGEIQKKQGVLMRYRAIQSLQLTELQAQVLEAITPEKIQDAPLKDLVMAYKILKDHELTIEGKPNEIKGLVGYLVQLEREEAALQVQPEDTALEAEFEEVKEKVLEVSDEDYIPRL